MIEQKIYYFSTDIYSIYYDAVFLQYLELRFNKVVRLFGTMLFIIQTVNHFTGKLYLMMQNYFFMLMSLNLNTQ